MQCVVHGHVQIYLLVSIPLHTHFYTPAQGTRIWDSQHSAEHRILPYELELVHRDLMSKEILCLHLRRCNIYSNKQSLGTGPQLPMPCLIILMVKKVSLSLSLWTSWRVLAPSSLPLPANSDRWLSPTPKAEDIQLSQPLLTHHTLLPQTSMVILLQNTCWFIVQGSPGLDSVLQTNLTRGARGE